MKPFIALSLSLLAVILFPACESERAVSTTTTTEETTVHPVSPATTTTVRTY